jgi:peptide deformylase
MTRLRILHHPDPRLRTKATPVESFDVHLGVFAKNLLETMYAAPGIGLAATQVNVHKRVIVVDVSEEKNQPHTLINPTLKTYGNRIKGEEGCLSGPRDLRCRRAFRARRRDRTGHPRQYN